MSPAQDNASAPSAAALMELAATFWAFKTLAAAVELELFGRLAGGRALTRDEVAAELDIQPRPADMFLAGCASLGLLDKDGDAYRNSALSEEFLVPGRPCYFGGFVRFCDHREYLPWHRLVAGLRGNRPLTWDPDTQDSLFSAEDPQMLGLFWEAMYSMSAATAQALDAVHDFTKHRRLLDVGGGLGPFPIELCRAHPDLSATVFDLDHVCGRTTEKISEAGLTHAISTAPGDFLTDPLPSGHDVVLLSAILHDWGEDVGRMLLRKCWESLDPGGDVLICELFLNAERTGPPNAALMGLNMIVETVDGRNYSEAEYEAWLTDAGFRQVRMTRFESAGANGVMTAVKP